MSFNHGAIWWSELMTRDLPASMAYYGAVCGWVFEEMPTEDGAYQVAIAHGKPVAGLMDMRGIAHLAEVPAHWFTYLAVDDVDRAMAQTVEAGGAVLRAPIDVPQVGRVVTVKDPGGAAVGLMTPVFPTDDLVASDLAAEMDAAGDDEAENFPV